MRTFEVKLKNFNDKFRVHGEWYTFKGGFLHIQYWHEDFDDNVDVFSAPANDVEYIMEVDGV